MSVFAVLVEEGRHIPQQGDFDNTAILGLKLGVVAVRTVRCVGI